MKWRFIDAEGIEQSVDARAFGQAVRDGLVNGDTLVHDGNRWKPARGA